VGTEQAGVLMDVSEYCRDLEAYLCRKNDGHLVRIVGPSFETVSRWAATGVPLKVAQSGIDRYFERYYRKGPRRRPVKIDFCEADVLDVFDEWRRATGVVAPVTGDGAASTSDGTTARKRGPSLPDHLERVLTRLSSLRATGALADAADPLLDRVSSELDAVRAKSAGLRGEERKAVIARLADLDAELLRIVRSSAGDDLLAAVERQAAEELAPFRGTMPADGYERAVRLAADRALRQRCGLPTIEFS
jgi:hypothetical protein